MRKQIVKKLMFLLLGLACLGLLAFLPGKANAANPQTINFQGKVVNSDGTNVANGTYSFVFRIYDTSSPTLTGTCASNSSCWWEETDSLTVTNGIFQVELGAVCALDTACNSSHSGINFSTNNSLYLTMKFNGDAAGFMSPLVHLNSVPYALQADNASTLGGLSNTNFVQLAQGLQSDSSTTNASIAINKTGSTANILTLQKSSSNVLILDNNGLLTLQPAASLTSGQTAFAQTITNASSTGGTVNAYTQTITVSNTSSGGTTNGINISMTDNTSLANTDQGIVVNITGTNTSQNEIGISSTVNKGTGILGTSTAASSTGCGGFSNTGAGVCGISNGGTTGVFGQFSGGSVSSGISDQNGTAIYGRNITGGIANDYNTGVKGLARNSTANTISIGVYGDANNSSGTGKVYGGYFQLQGQGSAGSALFASNNTNAVNILELQDNTTDVFTVGDGGLVTIKPATLSTSEFQIQTNTGNSLFNVDNQRTVNILSNGDLETATTHWTSRNSAGLARTTIAAQGNWALDATTAASAGSGAEYDINFVASKTYYLSFEARAASGSFSTFEFGHSNDAATSDVACQTGVTLTTTWQRFTCNWTTSGTVGLGNYIYMIQTDGVSRDIFIDSVQLENSTTSSTYNAFSPGGALQLNGPIESPVAIENRYDTTQAFQVQNASGANLLTIDSVNAVTNVQGLNSTATLGSELIDNGGSTTCSGTGWSGSGHGPYTHTPGLTNSLSCSPPANVTVGEEYVVDLTISSTTAGSVTPQLGFATGDTEVSNGSYEQTIQPLNATSPAFIPSSDFDGDVTINSVKQVEKSGVVLSVKNDDGSIGFEIRTGGSDGAGSSNENIFIGIDTGKSDTFGEFNTAVGNGSFIFNTTGISNNAFGHSSLYSNSTGNYNNAFGDQSLAINTSGSYNNALGHTALLHNTSGSYNSAFGDSALFSNTTGHYNLGIGGGALYANTTGNFNIGVGDSSNCSLQTGSNNVAVGYNTLCNGDIGNGNTALGDSAGSYLGSSSSNNLFLGNNAGYYTGVGTINLQNATAIGYYSSVLQDNSLILGGVGSHSVNVGIGTTSPTNTFSVSPDVYDTGTASVTSGSPNVTGTGTSWASNYAGMEFIFADGTKYTIQSVGSGTALTLSSNATATESGSAYRIHNPAFYVSSTGSTGIRTSTNSTSAFQVQMASGFKVLNVDTTNEAYVGNQPITSFLGAALFQSLNDHAAAFQIQDNGAHTVFGVDTSSDSAYLGEIGGDNGTLIFNNAAGSHTVGFSLQADPTSSYTLLLPTAGPSTSQCLQTDATTANQLKFAACSSGGGDNGFVNSVAVTDFNLQDVAGSGTVTGSTWSTSGSGPTNITLGIANADATHAGTVTNGSQTFAGVKTFQDFVVLQPAASMTAGQTALTQTITNASSTGGTVNGYSQTITVNNTTSASTTNGINISLTDNTAIANTNKGINVTLAGTNNSQIQIGEDINVNHGLAIRAVTSGLGGSFFNCGNSASTNILAICGADTSATLQIGSGIGILGTSNSAEQNSNSTLNLVASNWGGTSVSGYSTYQGTTNNAATVGVNGQANAGGSSGSYYSIGVRGIAKAASSSATAYGGYFALASGSSTTNGAALYATNSTVAGNILQLQNNTTDVMTVANGGHIYVNSTFTSMTAPSSLSATVAAGGALTAGTYKYYVTAIDSIGGETGVSNEATGTTASTNLTLNLSWTAVSGASGYKVYRTVAAGATNTEKYLTTVLTNSYSDTGSVTLGTAAFPSSNTAVVSTNNSNSLLQISVGGNGTPTGQVYVGGTQPTFVGINSDTHINSPYIIQVQGRYAYVINRGTSKLTVYDVGNPVRPTFVAQNSDNTLSSPQGMYVQGRYAYATSNSGSQFLVYDISNPNSPSLVFQGSDNLIKNPYGIVAQGRYAYILNSVNPGKLLVYDISNPASPVIVGKNADSNLNSPRNLFIQGRYAYIAGGSSGKLAVYDISNPASPTFVAQNSDSNLSVPVSVYVLGRYAYVTDQTLNKLAVYDVSNPASPTFVASTTTNLSSPQQVFVQGRYAYIAGNNSNKMSVFDISNPASPTFVASNSDSNLSTPQTLYVSGRYAYVGSASNIEVYDLGGLYTQQLEAGGAEFGTLNVDSSASFGGDASITGGLALGASLQAAGSIATSGNLYVQGTTSFAGGILGGTIINNLSAPSTPTVTTAGTTGTQTWGYKVVAVAANGSTTTASSEGTTTSANAVSTLTSSNYQQVTWSAVSGAVSYKVYRTTVASTSPSPSTTGLIATVSGTQLNDTGLAGDSSTPPVTDSTGNFTVNGLFTLQPATSLIAGQNLTTATFTNGSSTGGTVNGYSQTITVSNTTSASTTNGFNISLTDNTNLGNTNSGINISLTGTSGGSGIAQYGVNASVNHGVGGLFVSSGFGPNATCANTSNVSVGVCGDNTGGGTGVFGRSSGSTNTIGSSLSTGVYGINTTNSIGSGYYATGVTAVSSGSSTTGTSIGVYGQGSQGVGASIYGGYFTLGTGGATAGSALYASNSTVAANILQLQDNTTSVFTVGDNGLITASSNSSSGLVVNNSSSSKAVITIDTSANKTVLGTSGAGGIDGTLIFNTSAGANSVGFALQANPTSSYTLLLPTTGPSTSQCLQTDATTANQLKFAACSAGGGTNLSINGGAVGSSANFVDTTVTSTVAGIAYTNTSGTISTSLGIADGTHAGALNASTQTIGGDKTFQGATLFAPTGNNLGNTFKQTSGTATSGNVFDIQTANGSSHFIQITNAAANEGAVTVQSVGVTRDLTLDSASGTLKLGSSTTTLQKAASAFTFDLTNASTSTLTVSNSNGANVANLSVTGDIAAGSGHVYKVGATSGTTVSACGAGQYISSFASTGGIVTGGSCANVNGQTNLQNAYDNSSSPATITTSSSSKNFVLASGTGFDSTGVFQIQNDISSNALSVDTTPLNTLLVNSSFENSSTSNWLYSGGAGGSAARSTSQSYLGAASLAVTSGTSASANDGVKYVVGTTLSNNTTYTLSFYALLNSGTMTTLAVTYTPDGGTTNFTCTSGQTVITTAWQRYSCSFNSTQSAVNPNSSAYFLIKNGDTTTRTFYIDAVQIEQTSQANAYKETGINLQGTVTSNTIFSGLLTLQPASSLLAAQSEVQQTFTNGSSTGGTVNGYSQTITVNNTSSASTTNGFNISLTDNTSLANTNTGIKISLSGSNSNQQQVGVDSSANHGIGLRGISTGSSSVACGSQTVSLGVCGISQASAGFGLFGSSSGANGVGGGGESTNAGIASNIYIGLYGNAGQTNSSNYTSIGVVGAASGGAGATVYAGKFDLGGGGATAGAALYASNDGFAAKILQLQNNTTDVMTVGVNGVTLFQNSTDSSSAFQIKNTNSQSLLALDTQNSTDTSTTNLSNNPSVETAPSASDWVLKGTATIAQDSTTSYFGANSIKVTGAATNDGAFDKLNTTLSASTNYNITFYVKSNSAATQATIQAGYSINASAESVLCTNTLIVSSNGWYKYTCTILTPASGETSSNAIFVKTTDATARTINIDAVVVQQSTATSAPKYYEGGMNIQAAITSSLLLQNSTNSTQALNVRNSGGGSIFDVDTTSMNLVSNPSFEVSLAGGVGSGWTAFNGTASPTLSRDTTQAYVGSSSMKVVIGTNGTGGAQLALNPVVTNASTTYTVSFFALLSSGTAPTFQATYDPNGANPLTCGPSGTAVTTGWTRFSCTFGTNAITPSTSGFLRIAQTNSNTSTWFIDGVQLEAASAASNYADGNITLNGVITSPVTFESPNAISAFQIQNSSSQNVLGVDTINGQVLLGTSSALGGILVFNNSTNGNSISLKSQGGGTGTAPSSSITFALPNALPANSNYCVVSSNVGILSFLPCGASSTATMTLAPEFVGAVMTGDGSNNTGTMTSDYCAGTNKFPSGINTAVCNAANNNDEHNYYSWTSTGANDYEIFFRWSVPNDFASFPSSGSSFYAWKTGTAAGDDVKINVYNSSSTTCASQSMTNTATSWLSTNINLSGCAPTAGSVLTFDIHLSVSASGNFARIGEITLNYNRN